jgi:hypothetical protein
MASGIPETRLSKMEIPLPAVIIGMARPLIGYLGSILLLKKGLG